MITLFSEKIYCKKSTLLKRKQYYFKISSTAEYAVLNKGNKMNSSVDNPKCSICGTKNISYQALPFPSISPLSYSVNQDKNTIIWFCNQCSIIFRPTQSENKIYYQSPENDLNNIDSVVNVFSEKDGGHVTNHFVMARVLNSLLSSHQTNLLDIGCGNGYFLKELNVSYPKYKLHGFDIHDFLSQKFQNYENITYHQGEINNISEKFDAITFIDSLSFIKDIEKLMRYLDSNLNEDGIIFVTSPDISKNIMTLLMDVQHYYFTEPNLTNLFAAYGYQFNKINIPKIFPRHIFGYAKKLNTEKNFRKIQIKRTIDSAVDYMNKIKRDLRYLEKWWNNSLTSGIRLGVLGTKHNAAITLHALSKEISFVAEETEGYIGLNFHGKPIIHPGDMTDNDYLILPYGLSAGDIQNRFQTQYSGNFIII